MVRHPHKWLWIKKIHDDNFYRCRVCGLEKVKTMIYKPLELVDKEFLIDLDNPKDGKDEFKYLNNNPN